MSAVRDTVELTETEPINSNTSQIIPSNENNQEDVSEQQMSDTTTGKTQQLESEQAKNITPNVIEVHDGSTQTQAEVPATQTDSVDTRASRRLKKQRINDPSPKTENKAASHEQKRKRKRKK